MSAGKEGQHDKKSTTEKKPKTAVDADLDDALQDSFPASDPPSMTQPETEIGAPKGKHTPEQKKR